MKKLLYIIILVICTYAGYWIGGQTWILGPNNIPYRMFNTEEARLQEVQHCNAMVEGLHWYYKQDTTKWNNEFRNTKEFNTIDSLNQGDWEDFYSPNW